MDRWWGIACFQRQQDARGGENIPVKSVQGCESSPEDSQQKQWQARAEIALGSYTVKQKVSRTDYDARKDVQ